MTNLLNQQQNNPVIKIWGPNKIGTSKKFPIVGTTSRVTERLQAGAMSRDLPWLVELVPDAFVEISDTTLLENIAWRLSEEVKRAEAKPPALKT